MSAPDADADDSDRPPAQHSHRAEMSGSAAEVVQAREVHGGVHFHGAHHATEPVPRQLPGDIGGFVNRHGELDRLNEVVTAAGDKPAVVGVFVLTGTAGVGKTSLALHWAHSVRHRFPDGQLYVNLRGYDPGPAVSSEQALDRFLRALGTAPQSVPADVEDKAALYRSLLADRRVLVVLDNAATAKQVRPLLPGNGECLVLVTSRSRLSGLVARDGARRLAVDVLSENQAVDLLSTVITSYRPHDSPDALRELAALCARLPLALRIAAERASSRPLMHLDELIADLRDESALWDALTAEDDEEADAVRTVFAWSYRALPADAARLFRLLGLHPGPEFGLAAAAALADTTPTKVRGLLDVLVGAHVLEHHAPGRYQFHDLLRIYATEQATDHETFQDRRAALRRLLTWYLHAAHAAATTLDPHSRQITLEPPATPGTVSFADTPTALAWYLQERANLTASVQIAFTAGFHDLAWQTAAALRSIYAHHNFFDDWITTTQIGLDSARQAGNRHGEVELLDSLGKAHLQSQQLDRAEHFHSQALQLRRQLHDRFGEAISINALGLLAWRRRRLDQALTHFDAGLALFRELGDRRWEALLLSNLGMTYYDLARLDDADTVLQIAVALCREIGDRLYEGNALLFLAMTQREHDDLSSARDSIDAALAIAREEHNQACEAFWLLELARIQRRTGNADDALTSYQAAATLHRQLGDRNREAMAIDGTGETYQELDRPDEAAQFHRLAVTSFRDTGDRWALATALTHLAHALDEAGDSTPARRYWQESLAILSEFADPRAQHARDAITRSLTA
ncbi:tetratricopeptide repeat protein [Kutzneria viridogrisea]|uniref:Tetratricopeptide (TPR) repeat protein n=1 Tax=Kutzneria viridogrisea TaxID=47990 RepID=A0ABR6BIX5_9PSEU|nr:tetratricopeptide (TPR) repeat protein [Kutzneria viridogrisea]